MEIMKKEKNSLEVTALQAIIREQNALRASVPEDLDSDCYTWNQDGNLTEIDWHDMGLKGKIDVTEFASLTRLNVNHQIGFKQKKYHSQDLKNKLTELDVSKNTKLEELHCQDVNLPELDVSGNPSLKVLNCSLNKIKSLDVSRNPLLEYLDCLVNELSSLDISKNALLKVLYCNENDIKILDTTMNKCLEKLDCTDNPISELHVLENTEIIDADRLKGAYIGVRGNE